MNKTKRTPKKLVLDTQKIRQLHAAQLPAAAGGFLQYVTGSCYATNCCP
jgi:hypothetical protein